MQLAQVQALMVLLVHSEVGVAAGATVEAEAWVALRQLALAAQMFEPCLSL